MDTDTNFLKPRGRESFATVRAVSRRGTRVN